MSPIKYMLNQLKHIFLELGYGFSYVGDEYKIKVGNKNYYADLLLFNIKLNTNSGLLIKYKICLLILRLVCFHGHTQLYLGNKQI